MRLLLVLLLTVGCLPSTRAQSSPFIEDSTGAVARMLAHGMSALWGDYDRDGDLDLLVANTFESDALYRNEGSGSFSILPLSVGPHGAMNGGGWVDVDRDGRLDFLSSSIFGGALLLNTGSSLEPLVHVPSAFDFYDDERDLIAGDFDRDGDADVALGRRFGAGNLLFRNQGGNFTIVTPGGISESFDDVATVCWSDINGDLYPELYLVNTTGYRNRLYANNAGALREVTGSAATQSTTGAQGCAWGDYDGDGDLDLYVTKENSSTQGALANELFRNDDGVLLAASMGSATTDVFRSISAAWGDVDNDGDLDLVVSNHDAPAVLYLNGLIGAESKVFLGAASDGRSMGISLVDDDEDGDLDLYAANGGPRPDLPRERSRLFRNTTDGAAHWLQVDLRGSVSDRFGLGARVTAFATIAGEPRMLVREVQARPWRLAQDGFRLHFGLGDATTVDSLVVQWPASDPQVLYGVAADARVVVEEPGIVTGAAAPVPVGPPALRAYPNPSTDLVTVVASGLPDGPVRVEVLDVVGRRVGAMEGASLGGVARLAWDGGTVATGPYTLRLTGASDVAPVRVVIAR